MISTLTKFKMRLKDAINDYRCGKHSNFPLCCNLAYSIGDNLSELGDRRYFRYRRYFNAAVLRIRRLQFGYIPCPMCACVAIPNKVNRCLCHRNEEIMNNRIAINSMTNQVKYNTLLAKGNTKVHRIMDILLNENCAHGKDYV